MSGAVALHARHLSCSKPMSIDVVETPARNPAMVWSGGHGAGNRPRTTTRKLAKRIEVEARRDHSLTMGYCIIQGRRNNPEGPREPREEWLKVTASKNTRSVPATLLNWGNRTGWPGSPRVGVLSLETKRWTGRPELTFSCCN